MSQRGRRDSVQRLTLSGILLAVMLVLGFVEHLLPAFTVPGIKLGLSNGVLIFAVYMLDLPTAWILMALKVTLSGFLFSSPTVMLYSLAGSSLSLAVMMLIRKRPQWGALAALLAAAAVFIFLQGAGSAGAMDRTWNILLAGAACAAALVVWILIMTGKMSGVTGTSLAGAVAHNTGQVLVASLILRTPALLKSYLPVLVAIGGIVGCLTGIVAERGLAALRHQDPLTPKETPHEDE